MFFVIETQNCPRGESVIGENLLHYEIKDKIGVGGMGEVYRAHDSKLRRDVALKLLPSEVVHDPDKMARFEREARVLASLNHAHIGGIFGLENAGAQTFLVLELVEGEDLGAVLTRGPLPLDQVLNLGCQIAEGLETAHEQGIIHRDLKPQNIMLTSDGSAKILDFGLAKAFEVDPQDSSLTAMPTVTSARTMPGTIMGTAAYMSPEQARGTALDRRTDIWAFGCVMFEMISGRRVFDGETASDVLASVLKTDPAWDTLPDNLPPALRRLLERCFTRDPRKRLRDIGEARISLEAMLAGDLGEESEVATAAGGRGLGRMVAVAAVVGLVLGAVGVFAGRTLQETAPTPELRRFALTVAIEGAARRNDPVISPDGRRVVFEQGGEIWVQEMDQLESRRLEGIEGAEAPFWSPDGQDIGFFENSKMWRVPVAGGNKKLICDLGGVVAGGRGAHWTEDGTIIFSRGSSGILSAPAAGGDAREIIAVNDSTEGDLHEPFLMPDGGIMFVVHPAAASPGRLVIERDGQRQVLLDYPDKTIWNPRYDGNGYILLERDSGENAGVWALPYSVADRSVIGEPILIVPDGARPSISRDGLLVYSLNTLSGGEEQLVWVDMQGEIQEEITEILQAVGAVVLSPDGSKLAMAVNDNQEVDLWIQDLGRGSRTRLANEGVMDLPGSWTPDGERIVFFSLPPIKTIYMRDLDPTAPLDTLAAGLFANLSPDGRFLTYQDNNQGHDRIQLLEMDGQAGPTTLISGPGNYRNPKISPDGRYIAYVSDESGKDEIYLRTFPSGSRPARVSLEGGYDVEWTRDGRRLIYHDSASLFAVDVTTEPRLALSRPVKLFDARQGDFMLSRGFELSAEGDRVILVRKARPEISQTSADIVMVESWQQLLGDGPQ
jgi:Tol biopolymer transport system component